MRSRCLMCANALAAFARESLAGRGAAGLELITRYSRKHDALSLYPPPPSRAARGVYADKLGFPSLPRGSKAAAGPSSGSRREKAAAGERSAARAGPGREAAGQVAGALAAGAAPGWAGSSPPPAPGCELSRPASPSGRGPGPGTVLRPSPGRAGRGVGSHRADPHPRHPVDLLFWGQEFSWGGPPPPPRGRPSASHAEPASRAAGQARHWHLPRRHMDTSPHIRAAAPPARESGQSRDSSPGRCPAPGWRVGGQRRKPASHQLPPSPHTSIHSGLFQEQQGRAGAGGAQPGAAGGPLGGRSPSRWRLGAARGLLRWRPRDSAQELPGRFPLVRIPPPACVLSRLLRKRPDFETHFRLKI